MSGRFDGFEKRLREAVSPDVPAIAWGVWQGGETITGGIGATPQTPFSLASVTKPMTAMAVMRLVDQGLVELDAPISGYLAVPLEGEAPGATVRRVLDHTAGLPLHYQFFYTDEPAVPPPFAETIRRYGKTFWEPGARYLYSNLGYGLLDHLVEQVSGRSFAAYMTDEVFGPLGMRHASIGPSEGAAIPHGKGFAYPFYDFDHPGASAAFASVEDLLAFGRFHLHAPEPYRTMQKPSVSTGPGRGYGLGWGTDERGFFGHMGGMAGVRTILRAVPALDLVIAVVANGETDILYSAADDVVAAYAPDFPRPPTGGESVATSLEPPLQGAWQAQIETYQEMVELEIHLDDTFETREGRIAGVVDGDVKTEDAGRRPYRLHLDLALIDDRLKGAATAISTYAEGERLGNALSYRVELKR